MKQLLLGFTFIVICVLTTGCALITGGSSYYANIVLQAHPDAEIEFQGRIIGKGRAIMNVKRRDANKLQFTVKEEGCEPVPVSYLARDFRTGPFLWDYFLFSIPGLLIDGLTGAFWAPDTDNLGIQKLGPRNYLYLVSLPDCRPVRVKEKAAQEEKTIISTITLFDGKIITGKILENSPGNYLKVQLSDKSIKTIDYEQIIEISGAE